MPTQTIDFNNVNQVKFNNQNVNEVFFNSSKVWPRFKYLTFTSASPFTLKTGNNSKHWDGTIETSTDQNTWTIWNGEVVNSSNDGKLYLRGTSNTYLTDGISNPTMSNVRWDLSGTDISCSGDIDVLLDYQSVKNGTHPPMADFCFSGLFYNCTSLVNAPALPATNLTQKCYNSMFLGCTSLVNAPTLPATTLATRCYATMFYGCTSLVNAPTLPATTLANYCYTQMFYNCRSLVNAPALPATSVGSSAYSSMFYKCTSLVNAPTLPATTLEISCYNRMFYGCTSLVNAPALPATTLYNNCYYSMFEGCTNLESLPALYAKSLPTSCYNSMFKGCSKIKLATSQSAEYPNLYRIPQTGTGSTSVTNWNSNMFKDTGGLFTGDPSINTNYYTSNTIIS